MGFGGLAPSAWLLVAGVVLDAVLGDPQVSFHPIRIVGKTLALFERVLRRNGTDGYVGGCLLLLMLGLTFVGIPSAMISLLSRRYQPAGLMAHVLVIYTMLALRDLIDHVRTVQVAARIGDLTGAHRAIGLFVGRDTDPMDIPACRRAAIESLSENFVDGFVSPVFWYVLAGLPGLLLFKVVSTMDSMVGYKTERYLRFGWAGARLDDVMNYLPARLTWLLLGAVSLVLPGLSGLKGWRIGWQQHAVLPGPNPGWSEATMAGVLQRKLIGPIWKKGTLVTQVWLGDSTDTEAGTDFDVHRAIVVIVLSSAVVIVLSIFVLLWLMSPIKHSR
jgi:adenosylcobinamide-phosphate synthase